MTDRGQLRKYFMDSEVAGTGTPITSGVHEFIPVGYPIPAATPDRVRPPYEAHTISGRIAQTL